MITKEEMLMHCGEVSNACFEHIGDKVNTMDVLGLWTRFGVEYVPSYEFKVTPIYIVANVTMFIIGLIILGVNEDDLQ